MTIRCSIPDPTLIRTPEDVRRAMWTGFINAALILSPIMFAAGLAVAFWIERMN